MHALAGTPYLLENSQGERILAAASELADRVRLLRQQGTLDAKTLQRLREEWGVKQVYESAGIEGNQLDFNETRLVIQRGITIAGKPPRDSDEVRRLHRAHEYLESLAGSAEPITRRDVREIHSTIVGDEDPLRGAWRTTDVEITKATHKPPSPITIESHMQQYFEWLERSGNIPAMLRAAVAHAWLVHIHPFADGNGRTARAVGNLLLIKAGYPIVIVRRKDRPRYYEALGRSDDGDIGPFLELLMDRSSDSLAQIDRIRHAATGVSIALQRLREQEESKFRLWADGLRLFSSTVEHSFQQLSQDPDFRIVPTFYGLPDIEDFRKICDRDPSGNSWLLKIAVTRRKTTKQILLWIGFSSDEIIRGLKLQSPIPTVKISVPNPEGYPPWSPADESFESALREFAYHEGQFFALAVTDHYPHVRPFNTVVELANTFVAEVIPRWFA